jgi:large subunit ribosomal protein L10
MAITRNKKEQVLEELESQLDGAKAVVFADYRGTTVLKIDQLRRSLRKENVSTKVAKITLIKRALEKHGVDVSGMDFKAPVAIAVSKEDEVAPARILAAFVKENKNARILMGVMNNKVISAAEVSALAALPSKQELLAQVAGVLAGSTSGLASAMSGSLRSLAYAMSSLQESKQ